MKRLHLLGAIGVFTVGLGGGLEGAAHAEEGYVNDPQYAAADDDDATYQEAPCDGAQTSYDNGYVQVGGQAYVYNGQPYQYGAYNYNYNNGYGRQPSYRYVPVRRPYSYGRQWRRPWRWNHGYRVIVPPPARW